MIDHPDVLPLFRKIQRRLALKKTHQSIQSDNSSIPNATLLLPPVSKESTRLLKPWEGGYLDVLRINVGVRIQQQTDDSGVAGQHSPV